MSRVQKTLEGFDEVTDVKFQPALERFEVLYEADLPKGEEFKTAVISVIIMPGARKFLGGIGDQLYNSSEKRP